MYRSGLWMFSEMMGRMWGKGRMTEGNLGTKQWCMRSSAHTSHNPLQLENLEDVSKRCLEAQEVKDMGFMDTEQASSAG